MRATERLGIGVVATLLGAGVVTAVLVPPIPQDPAYHGLAATRVVWSVPNGLNVLSNVAFVFAGAAGLWALRPADAGGARFAAHADRWPWAVFFGGLLLTGIGSAYYHLAPDNPRLTWDRLPLAAALMGLFAAVLTERISQRLGVAVLAPLVLAGIGSVLWWHAGEARGAGDLRAYALVQFYPMLAIPVLLACCPPRYTLGSAVAAAIGLYALGKVFEWLDRPILAASSIVSGHTLKHLVAAAAGGVLAWMVAARQPCPRAALASPGPAREERA
jgi:hypothetical protein